MTRLPIPLARIPLARIPFVHIPFALTVAALILAAALPAAIAAPRTTAAARAAAAAATHYVSVSRDQINMRTGPGTNHESKWMLSRGYPLRAIGRQGDWLKVRDFENDEGWVSRPLTGSAPHHVVKSSTANIRSGPGTRYKRIGEASYGEVLETLERRVDWVKVRQDGGLTGWVAQRLLWGW